MSCGSEQGGRFVIIGTPRSAAGAAALLKASGVPIEGAIGLVIVGTREPAAEAGFELPTLGNVEDLNKLHERFRFDRALVSLPRSMSTAHQRVRTMLASLAVAELSMPTAGDVLSGEVAVAPIMARSASDLDMAALVGRAPRRFDAERVRGVVRGKRVLVTGAGGSIGSELARICATLEPQSLILMDRSDNALFDIDREIGARFPGVSRRVVLHDVVEADATLRRLVALRPDIVLHAAAHKHVPLMEDHPAAAVNNNLFGTKSIADAALATGVERFVMISTDKAVNPTSVMGATKRLAELYVRSLNGQGKSRFSLVRFGNVLGSACSVLPIWGTQLAEGGPITVTHPEMTRFFMTIPEAASLVMQAATLDTPEDVFILDMGEPVRILDLAKRFIRAYGFVPQVQGTDDPVLGHQMSIALTGSRPGEKLHEELAYQAEELSPTRVEGVMAWDGPSPDRGDVLRMVAELSELRQSHDAQSVIRALVRYVPTLSKEGSTRTGPTAFAEGRPVLSGVPLPDQNTNATAA